MCSKGRTAAPTMRKKRRLKNTSSEQKLNSLNASFIVRTGGGNKDHKFGPRHRQSERIRIRAKAREDEGYLRRLAPGIKNGHIEKLNGKDN